MWGCDRRDAVDMGEEKPFLGDFLGEVRGERPRREGVLGRLVMEALREERAEGMAGVLKS